MKRCPSCNRTFDDDSQMFCSTDGTRLLDEASQDSFDPEATLMSPPSRRPSNELAPPPEAFNTNVGTSGQFDQTPPPPQQPQNQELPPNDPYKTNASTNASSWINPQQPPPQNQQPPPQNPTEQAPSAPLAPAKRGTNTKLLIGGGVGCLGLIILGVIGIALFFVLSGPSSNMNPYTGSLRDLAPQALYKYKQTDFKTLGSMNKEAYGSVKEGVGCAYVDPDNYKAEMFILNYASADEAKYGFRTFKSSLSARGWNTGVERDKRIGWRTVGIEFSGTNIKMSGNRRDDEGLPGGARLRYAQATDSSQTPSKSNVRDVICWTNGSVLYILAGPYGIIDLLEKEMDKVQ